MSAVRADATTTLSQPLIVPPPETFVLSSSTIEAARQFASSTENMSVRALISYYSDMYDVSSTTMYNTLRCESKLKPTAIGDYGHSFGVAQIHLPSHPEVTRTQALNPKFAVEWTAKAFSQGRQRMWSCYRLLYM